MRLTEREIMRCINNLTHYWIIGHCAYMPLKAVINENTPNINPAYASHGDYVAIRMVDGSPCMAMCWMKAKERLAGLETPRIGRVERGLDYMTTREDTIREYSYGIIDYNTMKRRLKNWNDSGRHGQHCSKCETDMDHSPLNGYACRKCSPENFKRCGICGAERWHCAC